MRAERSYGVEDWIALVCTQTCCILTISTCTLLLFRLCRLPRNQRSKLFILQMILLSGADLVMTVSHIPIDLAINAGIGSDAWCQASYTVFRRSRFTSCIIEFHISLSFLSMLVCSCRYLARMLRALLVIFVLAGTVLSLLDSFEDPVIYDTVAQECKLAKTDVITITAICSTGALSVILYIVLFIRVVGPHPELRWIRSLALVYPLNFLVTYSIDMVLYLEPHSWHHSMIWGILARTLEDLGGFLNVLVYWQGARHLALHIARTTSCSTGSAASLQSFFSVGQSQASSANEEEMGAEFQFH